MGGNKGNQAVQQPGLGTALTNLRKTPAVLQGTYVILVGRQDIPAPVSPSTPEEAPHLGQRAQGSLHSM